MLAAVLVSMEPRIFARSVGNESVLRSTSQRSALNDAPVIGVLTQPADPDLRGTQYLVASYVNWIESAGARVAPVFFNATPTALESQFSFLSGLLLPGGHCGSHQGYGEAVDLLLGMAKKSNDAGRFFPVWGTCQGHQQLAQFGSNQSDSVLVRTTGTEGWITWVNLTGAGQAHSRILGDAPGEVIMSLTAVRSTINLHHFSVPTSVIERPGSHAHAFFEVVGTNVDQNGVEFTSIIEARRYPFYSTQFHPEKNAYEFEQGWERNNTMQHGEAHGRAAVQTSQYLANFFVGEARKSPYRWPSEKGGEMKLIYEYGSSLRRTDRTTTEQWEQCYVW